VKYAYHSQAIYSIVMAGVFLFIAAFCVRFVDDKDDVIRSLGNP
jgi:maltose/moltooligosaccharide transporter